MDSSGGASAADGLEMIRAGLAALAASDIDGHGAAGLGEECVELLRLGGTLQVQVARRLARFVALNGPAAESAPSAAAWLGRRSRLRPWEARQLATLSSRWHLLGESVTALEADRIGYGDLATIAEGVDRAADTMTEGWDPERVADTAQPILLEVATKVTPAQLRTAALRVALTLDGGSAQRRSAQIDRQSHLSMGQTIDGIAVVRADMGPADFAIVEKAIDVFAPAPDPGRPVWENLPGHRRLRGLVTACEIALRSAGRHGYRDRGGAPVRVHLIAGAATGDPDIPAAQAPPGRTEFDTIVPASQVREMMDRPGASTVTVRVGPDGAVADRYDSAGRPLNWGRTRRLFTAAQREVFLALHAGCAADGCDRPLAWTDIDHRTAWINGGRTDLDNGQPLCRFHNLEKENNRAGRSPRNQTGREPAGPDP